MTYDVWERGLHRMSVNLTKMKQCTSMASLSSLSKSRVSSVFYRDTVHIRKDIIAALVNFGEMNQSKLFGYCSLNSVKHKKLLLELLKTEMVIRVVEQWPGGKVMVKYQASELGKRFLTDVLQPYEQMFPRIELHSEITQ
jgi:predicted transcriptional regulator